MMKVKGVIVHRFRSCFNLGHMSFFPGMIQLLKKENFNIIHAHVYRHPHVEIASLIGRQRNIPTILHGHGPFFSRRFISKGKAFLYSLYDRMASLSALKRINHIIALTEYEKQHYKVLNQEKCESNSCSVGS